MIIFSNQCILVQNILCDFAPSRNGQILTTKSCRQNNELLYKRIAAPWRPFDFPSNVWAAIFLFSTKTGQFVIQSCKNGHMWPNIYQQNNLLKELGICCTLTQFKRSYKNCTRIANIKCLKAQFSFQMLRIRIHLRWD